MPAVFIKYLQGVNKVFIFVTVIGRQTNPIKSK